jgi:hypothetical protein
MTFCIGYGKRFAYRPCGSSVKNIGAETLLSVESFGKTKITKRREE